MKTYIKTLLVIGAIAVVGCISMGLALSMAVGEIEGLRLQITELQYELENRQELIGHWGESREISRMDDERAFLEVANKLAELQSANITIDTPDAHIHIEWER